MGSEVDLNAIKPNKFSEAASREDGELLIDDTRNSTAKLTETNPLDNTAVMSRSQ